MPVSWWCVFDETFSEVGNAFNGPNYLNSIPPPQNPQAVLDAACRVGSAIPRPYLRVDVMEDSDGPLVCEVTPEPGGAIMAPAALDRRLGKLWEDAEVRLRVRAVMAGLLDPVAEPLTEASLRP